MLTVMENSNKPYNLDANYEHVSIRLAKLGVENTWVMSDFSGPPCFSVSTVELNIKTLKIATLIAI